VCALLDRRCWIVATGAASFLASIAWFSAAALTLLLRTTAKAHADIIPKLTEVQNKNNVRVLAWVL
jgi:hypothetical protein